ncbi:MAG: TetR/AcrR family transcriptional regulator [Proteobacteria bacterium]|nr:TetR/AcrR family transcriptional regulator [Pseudomonadota bacterium]
MTEPLTDGKKPISKKAAKGSRKRTDKSSKSKVPKQLRSQKTRSRILKAARNLFAQRGYYQVNSNQIAAEAGVSVGTFYTYFKDKKEILLEILYHFYKHFWADVSREAQNDLPESYDLKLVLRSIVKKSFEAIDHDPDFSRLVYSMKFYDDDIRKTFEEIEKREVNHAAFTLGFSQGAITVKDRKAAALIVMKLIESLGLSDFPIDREVLVDEVTKMIYLYFTQS